MRPLLTFSFLATPKSESELSSALDSEEKALEHGVCLRLRLDKALETL